MDATQRHRCSVSKVVVGLVRKAVSRVAMRRKWPSAGLASAQPARSSMLRSAAADHSR